jgi:hypothetical protein
MPDYHYPGDEPAFTHTPGRVARWILRASPWPIVLAASAVAAGYFWRYRLPSVAIVGLSVLEDACPLTSLFVLIVLSRAAQLLARLTCEAIYGVRSRDFRSRRWCWPWLLVIAAGTYYLIGTKVPMRVCFWLSRPALDDVATQALADPANAHILSGRWAGLYRIAGVEVIGSTVVVYTDEDKGTYGFVRAPDVLTDTITCGDRASASAEQQPDFPIPDKRNSDREAKRIGGDWFVMYSWYSLVKVGWS